jgi:hypothetical protein
VTVGSNSPAARVAAAYRQRGQKITLRMVTEYDAAALTALGITPLNSGTERVKNPPQMQVPTSERATLAGSTSATLRCEQSSGLLLAGDKVRVVGETAWHTISAPVLLGGAVDPLSLPAYAEDPFVVTTAFPAAGALPAGTYLPLEFMWLADKVCWARVGSFPVQLVDGQNILSGDLRITLPAYGLPRSPAPGDRILLAAPVIDAEVKSADPVFLPTGGVSHYQILAR